MKVLVVNAGSSSLKYQLFDTATESVLARVSANGSASTDVWNTGRVKTAKS